MSSLVGGWRSVTLAEAVRGERSIDSALHLVGIRGASDRANQARQDLADAMAAYRAGDPATALATAHSLAEEIQRIRQPGRGAAA